MLQVHKGEYTVLRDRFDNYVILATDNPTRRPLDRQEKYLADGAARAFEASREGYARMGLGPDAACREYF
jgi:hypothetical protein